MAAAAISHASKIKISKHAIIGIAIAGVVVLILFIVAACCCWRCCFKGRKGDGGRMTGGGGYESYREAGGVDLQKMEVRVAENMVGRLAGR